MLLIVAIVLLSQLGACKGGKKQSPSDEVCNTDGCVRAANQLKEAMNTSVDPCENFFEFTCGQWNKDHPIPDDKSNYHIMAEISKIIEQQMRALLEANTTMESDAMEMVRTVYKACMNTNELESLKSKPLLIALDSLGGWPVLGAEPRELTTFNLTELLAVAVQQFETRPFFLFYIYADDKNTTRNIITLDQAGPSIPRDYFLNTTRFASQIEAYKKFQRKIVALLSKDGDYSRKEANVNADLSKMFEFETKFAKILVPREERRNSTRMYNMRRISDLASLLPKVDWLRFFRNVSPPEVHELINNDTELVVSELGFMKDMTTLLEESDDRVIVNYILWRVIYSIGDQLDSRFDDIGQDLAKALYGRETKPTRWKVCVDKAKDSLELASGALYVREHFDSNGKKEALEMIKNLQLAFKGIIMRLDWMDEATKSVAVKKLNGMIKNIGYPDFIANNTALDNYYTGLDLRASDSYVELNRKLVKWALDYYFMQLTKDFDKTEFPGNPADVNAYYSPVMNSITFLAGILQPPIFSGDFPKMVNYAAIGTVIGHELTHGFDDQGSQYDEDGNLRDWWTEESMQKFTNRTKCMIDQYSSYQLPSLEVKVNGKLTQGENIADNGGLKESYMAYRQYIKKLGHEELKLPGLEEYTNDQIFFLSFGHVWCGSSKDEAAVQRILTDPHSPDMFRVIGALSNSEEFSKAFKCASGTPLNPEKKCTVW